MKNLLLPCALAVAATAAAFEPTIIPQSAIYGFSPDNRIAVSEYYGSLFIFDLQKYPEAAPTIYSESADGLTTYTLGMGSSISDKFICTSRGKLGSAVWSYRYTAEDALTGRFLPINSKESGLGMGMPNAVTPDSKRICGNVVTGIEFGVDVDGMMVAPCIWDYNGKSFARTTLPTPMTDHTGLSPMYSTALDISDDGKTIIGQTVSNNGFLKEYIIYTLNDEGNWTARKPFADLVNPNHIEIPALPEGPSPAVVIPESYMTEEQAAAYYAAMDEWNANGAIEDQMPNPGVYMYADSIVKYNEAAQKFNDWNLQYREFEKTDSIIREESISFVFNQGRISPNGKYLASSVESGYYVADGYFVGTQLPFLYDIENDKILLNGGDKQVLITAVGNDGTLVGYERRDDVEYGCVLPAGATEWVPLEQWVVERNPELAQWVEENWKHEVQVIIDPDEDITEFQEMYITGMPFMSRDFSMVSTIAYTFWDGAPAEYANAYCSYLVPLGEFNSISEVSAEAKPAGSDATYNLQGIRVDNPSAPGIYIRGGKKFIVK